MKLIRLLTEDKNGIFNNTFNEDIILEPYSKIALQNLTTQLKTDQIIIDAQNNGIECTIANNTRTILLNHNIVDRVNVDDFFNDITYKFNSALLYNENEIGRQYLASTLNNRLAIQLRTGTVIKPIDEFNNPTFTKFIGSKNVQIFGGSSNPRIGRPVGSGTDTTNDSFVYLKSPICKGVGTLRSRIYSNTNTSNGGYIIAYLSKAPDLTTTVINPADIVFGIRFVDTTQPYKIYKNGAAEAPTTVLPLLNSSVGAATNDMITLDSYNGQLIANVWNTDPLSNRVNGLLIDAIPYNHTDNLWPVVIFVSTHTLISDIAFTSDPFYNDTNNINVNIKENDLGAVVSLKGNKIVNTSISFISLDLAKSLGFTEQEITNQTNSSGTAEYQASKPLSFRDLADSYILDLLNINVNSYDSHKKQHRNILAVIPQFDVVRERVIYTAPNPVFLDINNKERINLREIRARILKEDLSGIVTTGYSQVTLLIDN